MSDNDAANRGPQQVRRPGPARLPLGALTGRVCRAGRPPVSLSLHGSRGTRRLGESPATREGMRTVRNTPEHPQERRTSSRVGVRSMMRAAAVSSSSRPNQQFDGAGPDPRGITGDTTQPVQLSAGLSGPFTSAAAAKHGHFPVTFTATPLRINEGTGGTPVSRIAIPRGT